jgi:hypothetical protein
VLGFTTILWPCSLFIQNDECATVRKCVSFPAFPQLVVILPVKRFAGDCRPKSPLPSHKKAPARDSTLSLRAAAIICFHAKRTTWVCELMAERRQERHFFSCGACRRSFPNARLWFGSARTKAPTSVPASSLRLKIGGDAEFLPNSCFL